MVLERRKLQEGWRAITKDELRKLVEQMPLTHIAERYNVSRGSSIAYKCKKLGISIPKQGYWQKRYWATMNS
jgi:hypothetical protein